MYVTGLGWMVGGSGGYRVGMSSRGEKRVIGDIRELYTVQGNIGTGKGEGRMS